MQLSKVDSAEFQRKLFEHAPSLRAYVAAKISSTVGRLVSPDDILQEVWIKAFRSREQYDASRVRSFERWLTVIANRVLIDHLRRQRAEKRRAAGGLRYANNPAESSMLDLFARLAGPAATPSSEVAVREALDSMKSALGSLPEDQRKVVWMRHMEGRSYAEISGELNKTRAAVRGLLTRGLQQLRSDLSDPARFFSDVDSVEQHPDRL